MENSLINPEVTLLIHGKINTDFLNRYLSEYYNTYIVISTFHYEPWVNSINFKLLNNYKHSLILNMERPSNFFSGFLDLYSEIKNIYTALNSISTKYTILLKGEEHYSNLEYIFKTIEHSTRYLFCTPIFFRPSSFCPFHISDNIIAGTTKNLVQMYTSSYENFKTNKLEFDSEKSIYITKNYLYNKFKTLDIFDEKVKSNKVIMKNYFSILDLEFLKPYTANHRSINFEWHNNFIPENYNSISNMQDY